MKQKAMEYLKTGSNFIIRNMKKEERKQVRKLVWHCFPITEAWPFRFTTHVLVVEYNEKIVGAVVPRIFTFTRIFTIISLFSRVRSFHFSTLCFLSFHSRFIMEGVFGT